MTHILSEWDDVRIDRPSESQSAAKHRDQWLREAFRYLRLPLITTPNTNFNSQGVCLGGSQITDERVVSLILVICQCQT